MYNIRVSYMYSGTYHSDLIPILWLIHQFISHLRLKKESFGSPQLPHLIFTTTKRATPLVKYSVLGNT